MNEELKILIKAVTTEAKKNLEGVKKELKSMEQQSTKSGNTIDKALKGIAKSAKYAMAAIGAITAAMVALGKSAQDTQKGIEKLNTTFKNAGMSSQQASQTYKDVFSFLGDHNEAVEVAQSLALIADNEKDLAEWTQILKGAWAEMGTKLPIDGLAEAANETINVGKVVGVMADALTWAGISEDAFNASLAQATSAAEREMLVRSTLNSLYGNSAKLYDAANQSTLRYNEAQANLNITMGKLAQYLTPMLTAIINLGNVMLTALAPAIRVVSLYLTAFIQLIVDAIQWIGSFFGLFKSSTEEATADWKGYQSAYENWVDSIKGANTNLEETEDQVKAIKKQLMGFDELNVVSDPNKAAADVPKARGIDQSVLNSAPKLSDFGLDTVDLGFESFKKDLEDTKILLKYILGIIGLIAAGVLLWRAGNFLADLGTAHGLLKKIDGLDLEQLSIAGWLTPDQDWAIKFMAPFEKIRTFLMSLGSLVGGGLSAGLAIVAAAIAAVAAVVYYLYQNWESVVNVVKRFIDSNIAPKFERIKTALQPVIDAVKAFFAELDRIDFFERLLGGLGTAFETIGGIIFNVVASVIAGAISSVVTIIEGFVTAVRGIVDVVVGVVQAIGALLTGDFQGAWDAAKKAVMGVVGLFKGLYDMTIGAVVEFVKGIIDWFVALWDELVGHSIVPDMIEAIIKWFKELPGKLFGLMADFVKKIIAYFADLAKQAGQKASDMVAKVKAPFSSIASWFKTTFKNAWDGVKSVFSGVSSFFSGIFNTIKGIFSKVGTTISQGITGAVKGAINSVLSSVVNKINGFIDMINGAIGLINKIPGVNLSKLSKLTVPKLATGGITTGATLAMIGERGKEAVLPLENNTGWMDALADRIAARSQGPSKVVLQVGERELGWAAINSINGITKQTGGLQLHIV